MLKFGRETYILTNKHPLPITSEKSFTLLSHAHWDHLRYCKEQNIYCTFETSELIKHIFAGRTNPWPYKHELCIEDISIRLFPAGHILGSAQFLIQTPSTSYAITADFKLEDSLLFSGAEILSSENLIIETTFAKPEFSFPSRETLYSEISKWINMQLKENKKVILFSYPLGKAQELVALLNKYLGITPAVSWDIYYFCDVYRKFGYNLNYSPLKNIQESDIIILPRHYANIEFLKALVFQGIKYSSAYFSGFALKNNFRLFDKAFPLSDHADFKQLLRYVEQSNAKRIYTYHGFAKEFASYLNKKGYSAKVLSRQNVLNYC